MGFYIATRDQETKVVSLEYHFYTNHKDATAEAAQFTARNGLLRRNVIVVEADDDVKALREARKRFQRGG